MCAPSRRGTSVADSGSWLRVVSYAHHNSRVTPSATRHCSCANSKFISKPMFRVLIVAWMIWKRNIRVHHEGHEEHEENLTKLPHDIVVEVSRRSAKKPRSAEGHTQRLLTSRTNHETRWLINGSRSGITHFLRISSIPIFVLFVSFVVTVQNPSVKTTHVMNPTPSQKEMRLIVVEWY